MKFFGKLLIFSLVLLTLFLITATAVVHFYLTDERIRNLIIPQAETALERTVEIGAIEVGLFSGITINDFTIKEKDQQKNFLKTDAFEISYDLFPLLQKKFIVSEIRLNNPSINIVRDKNGTFNFQTLALLNKDQTSHESKQDNSLNAATATALPIALTIDKIKITNATLSIVDQKEEIPNIQANANLNVSVALGTSLNSLQFKGDLDASANAQYGEIATKTLLKANFNQQKISYNSDITIGTEKLNIEGSIDKYQSGSPEIICNINSPQLNLNYLAALAASLPKPQQPEAAEKIVKESDLPRKAASSRVDKPTKEPLANAVPAGLTAQGLISIEKTSYNKLVIENFRAQYKFIRGILNINDLSAETAGGSISNNTTVDLNAPNLAYKGNLNVTAIDLQKLSKGLEQNFGNIITGSLQSKINFKGKGTTPEVIKKHLSADVSYSITNGKIQNTPMTQSIANITGLKEFEEITFKDINGDLTLVEGGKIQFTSSMNGSDLGAKTDGIADLDGNIDIPLTITLSPAMSQKLDKKKAISKFLANDKGETELQLQIKGTVQSPKTSLDLSGVEKQVEETLKKKAVNELDRFIKKQTEKNNASSDNNSSSPTPEEQGLNLLKGLFGN